MTVWTDVPDPRDDVAPCLGRCEVAVSERAWRHIAEKHVVQPHEPWDEWLSSPIAEQFRRAWFADSTETQRVFTVSIVADIIEDELKQSLAAPLALIYDDYQSPGAGNPTHAQETWGLVLPSGAFLVIRSDPAGGHVRSCYFRNAACRVPLASRRWRAVVENLVLTYATVGTDGAFLPRGNADAVMVDASLRVRIRFRTNQSWRVDGSRPQPWAAISDPWQERHMSLKPVTGLRPRRSY